MAAEREAVKTQKRVEDAIAHRPNKLKDLEALALFPRFASVCGENDIVPVIRSSNSPTSTTPPFTLLRIPSKHPHSFLTATKNASSKNHRRWRWL
jgi:hypothetical protein